MKQPLWRRLLRVGRKLTVHTTNPVRRPVGTAERHSAGAAASGEGRNTSAARAPQPHSYGYSPDCEAAATAGRSAGSARGLPAAEPPRQMPPAGSAGPYRPSGAAYGRGLAPHAPLPNLSGRSSAAGPPPGREPAPRYGAWEGAGGDRQADTLSRTDARQGEIGHGARGIRRPIRPVPTARHGAAAEDARFSEGRAAAPPPGPAPPAGTDAAAAAPAGARPDRPPRRRARRGILAGLLALSVCASLGLGGFAMWVRGLDVSKLSQPLPEPTLLLDANGQPAAELAASKIVPVPIDEIPLDLRNALIAVEDQRFYEHAGFDLWSIGRAIVRDIRSGSLKEGGSTITQQLAKNQFLEADKTFTRKLQELGYAIKINFTYSKDEILELYLNSIYFGEGRWGVEGAAREYFGKPVRELTLAESALIAGLPKAPSRYSPFKNMDKALERRNLVLSLMKQQHFITEEEYRQAVATPISLRSDNLETLKGKHPSFTDYVMDEAERLYGFTEQQVLTMGLRIHTTMDPIVQQAAEEVFADDALFPASPPDQPVQSAAVVLDHRTGEIKAIVGGRGEQIYRGFNRATELKRQPGSAFKPLAVYGPALERGYRPDSPLYDGELDIGGYRPSNWDGKTHGVVSLQEAVKRSWNIPAVWLLNEIGIDAGLDYLRRAGIELPAADRNLSLALGGLSEGVSPLQMAAAYGGIANLGERKQAHAITRITTKEGHLLVEAAPQSQTMTTPVHAYTLTRLLEQAVASGTGQAAQLDGRPTAGKTGTTQLPDTKEFAGIGSGGAKDAWFVGFTPELTAAVWLGYDRTDRSHYLTTGSAAPASLFREIASRALKNAPPSAFPVPEEVRQALIRENERKEQKRADEERKEKQKKDSSKENKKNEKGRGNGKKHGNDD